METGTPAASLLDVALQQPTWMTIWLFWLAGLNAASILFVRQVEPRWVLAAFLANVVFMSWFYPLVNDGRLMGLGHILFWTPLLIYLYRRRPRLESARLSTKYLYALFITDSLALATDYINLARYLIDRWT
ncbi:MAG: hypothetical protein RIC93_08510 [Alphaproteobacteria bacterium]